MNDPDHGVNTRRRRPQLEETTSVVDDTNGQRGPAINTISMPLRLKQATANTQSLDDAQDAGEDIS